MLMPLLLIWPLSVLLIQNVANGIADDPYDQALAENAMTVARLVSVKDGKVRVDLHPQASSILRRDENDTFYFQVLGFRNELVAGDLAIRWVEPPLKIVPGQAYFRDDDIKGEEIRVAYLYLVPLADKPPILVQVAETRNKRNALAGRILSGVTLPQFAVIPLAVLLVWFGLSRGIAPLKRLSAAIRRRLPTDLSPIPTSGVPEEVKPVIHAFNDMMARLELNLQAQQRFIGDAAHQMRTPLAALRVQAQLALDEDDPAEQRAQIAAVERNAARLSRLLNQLLSDATIAHRSDQRRFERFDVVQLTERALRDVVPSAEGDRVHFESELDSAPFTGDAVMIGEAVKNLVDNALRHGAVDGAGAVEVRLAADDQALALTVSDRGPGLGEADREKVFERFARGSGAAPGAGLGLAIVRQVARSHGGDVRLLGRDGGGLCAELRLPWART